MIRCLDSCLLSMKMNAKFVDINCLSWVDQKKLRKKSLENLNVGMFFVLNVLKDGLNNIDNLYAQLVE